MSTDFAALVRRLEASVKRQKASLEETEAQLSQVRVMAASSKPKG